MHCARNICTQEEEELRELATMRDGTIATLRKKVEDMTEAMKTQDPWHAAAAKANEEDDRVEALVKNTELLEKMAATALMEMLE